MFDFPPKGQLSAKAMCLIRGEMKKNWIHRILLSGKKTGCQVCITSKNLRKIYPFEVYLGKGTGNLPKNSKVKADQIRTLDKSRLVRLIGELGITDLEAIEKALKIHLGL